MMDNDRIKELPASMRPYEKCMLYGAGALSDVELLAVIIKSGTRGCNCVELARDILMSASPEGGVGGLAGLTYGGLCSHKGIGWVKAVQILSAVELSRRIAKATAAVGLDFGNPDSIARYYMEDMRHLRQEQLVLVMLDTKLRRIADCVVSKGTVSSSLVSPREVFIQALQREAVYICLLHNHPSGDPTPSSEDIAVTRRIEQLGRLLDVRLIDHIIIGDNTYVSMKNQNIMNGM
jgi:DNA repair protein RadC